MLTACNLHCVNGGILNETSCTCDCPSIYSGDVCNSRLTIYMYRLYIYEGYMFYGIVCSLTCMNGGMLNETSCTCDCPKIYRGTMCESEFVI